MKDLARQTGRTTKMLREAVQALRDGRDAVVVVHHHAMLGYCQNLLRDLGLCSPQEVRRIVWLTADALRYGLWRGLSRLSVHVDHFVWDMERVPVEDLELMLYHSKLNDEKGT